MSKDFVTSIEGMNGRGEIPPEVALGAAVIERARIDQDWEWLASEYCAYWCHLVGLNHGEICKRTKRFSERSDK